MDTNSFQLAIMTSQNTNSDMRGPVPPTEVSGKRHGAETDANEWKPTVERPTGIKVCTSLMTILLL
jgi:hypothetical protein